MLSSSSLLCVAIVLRAANTSPTFNNVDQHGAIDATTPGKCDAWPGYDESCCLQPTNAPTEAPKPTEAPIPGDDCCLCATSTESPLSTTSSVPSCPHGWIDGGYLGCFYFHYQEKNLNWVEAQAACEMLGGYLAEIKTEEQNNFVESMAIIEENFSGVKNWWLGLSDMGHEGRWMWGHSVADADFTSWGPGHPNTDPGNQDDCVAITLKEHFHWKDLSCSKTHHTSPSPICQRDVESMTTTQPPPSTTTFQGCPNEWSQYESSCYIVVVSNKDWSQARSYCNSLDAELPSIHSQLENNFILNLAKNQVGINDDIWIGGTDERIEGTWEWTDGSTWSYENWLSGQPDTSSQDALALDTRENGKWRDLPTDGEYNYFLCKMY